MLSILIPIYNFNVVAFVKELQQQALGCDIDFEIICIDDCSEQHFKEQNLAISSMKEVVYEELQNNIGRSKIRNLLAKKAIHKNLLFLDCDSEVIDNKFIRRYKDTCNDSGVVYGGRCYRQETPINSNEHFRWWYGVQRETISAANRIKNPYDSFMTNNFLVKKSVYQAIKLDEEIKGYGHEDTLFGLELKKQNLSIKHIENPLCHIGLEPFDEYLAKTEEGIRNLYRLIEEGKIDKSVKLYRYYLLLKKIGLTKKIFNYYNENRETILEKLKENKPKIRWFDLYKLGYLISLTKS